MAKRDGSQSINEWRQTGREQQQLVGYLAYSIGLIEQESDLTAEELLAQLTRDNWQASVKSTTP